MLKTVFNKLLLVVYFVLGALILEFVTFNILNFGFAPSYFWSNLAIILILALIIYAIPNFTAQYVVYSIILLVQTVFIYVNYSLYTIFGDLFSFDMMRLIGEAGAAMTSSFVYLSVILQLIAVYLSIVIVGAVFLHFAKKDKIKIKQHYSIFNVIVLLAVQCFAVGYYVHHRNYLNEFYNKGGIDYVTSDTFLMNTSFLKTSSYAKFGTYGYFLNLIINSIYDYNSIVLESKAIDFFNNGHIYSEEDSEHFGIENQDTKRNNVIVIMMESLEWFGFGDGNFLMTDEDGNAYYDRTNVINHISQEMVPNFYSLFNDNALLYDNFYSKSKTNFSEGIGVMGNYPAGQSLVEIMNKDKDKTQNLFGYSMPNVLKSQGYTTNYVHSNTLSFYEREKTHNYIGFENIVGKNTIKKDGKNVYSDFTFDNWAPEEEIVDYAMDYIVPVDYIKNPFYSFYLNVTTHGPYAEVYNLDKDKNIIDWDYLRYKDYVIYGKENCEIVEFVDLNKDEKNKTYAEARYFQDEEGNDIKGVNDIEEIRQQVENSNNYMFRVKDELIQNKLADDGEHYSTWYKNLLNTYDKYAETDETLTQEAVYYECGVVGLDTALGKIINKLKNSQYPDGSSLYDNTTLVLYSDHNAYYATDKKTGGFSNRIKRLAINEIKDIELNTVPFIISSPSLRKEVKEQSSNFKIEEAFCSAYDIVPTLFDLLGIEFNENFYVGRSLFANDFKDDSVYYSNTNGIFGKDLYTDNLYDFYNYKNERVQDDEILVPFVESAKIVLTKINYLHILHNRKLFRQITNI